MSAPVHADDAVVQTQQRMQKVDARLADLHGLMVKYGNTPQAAADSVATEIPRATGTATRRLAKVSHRTAAVVPAAHGTPTSRVADVSSQHRAARPAVAERSSPSVVATHSGQGRKHAPAIPEKNRATRGDAYSPALASDAQIAAVMSARGQASHPTAGPATAAGPNPVWVVASDGSLHVGTNQVESPQVATAVVRNKGATKRAAPTPPETPVEHTLPAVSVDARVAVDMPSREQLQQVADGVEITPVQPDLAHADAPRAPRTPLPRRPEQAIKQQVVDVPDTAFASSDEPQTSSLVLDVNPFDVNLAMAGMAPVALGRHGVVMPGPAMEADAGHADPASRLASVGAPVPYRFGGDSASAGAVSGAFNMNRSVAPPMMSPMAISPGDPRRPRPVETPSPGLIVSNNGLVGGALGLLGNSTDSLFNGSGAEHYLSSGNLRVSNANFSQGYGVLTVVGIPTVNLTPVGGVLKDLGDDVVGGTGINSHLTLIGGVTSGNYITNINNGAAGGLLGLVLPTDAPDWASECANVLGLIKADCWGVNAAQDYQVLVGDGASANGSKEVVIGTNASHTLAEVDADTAFPGDGRNDSTNPSGVPTSTYADRLGHSVVIGDDASGSMNGQTILGASATSDQANSVALGFESDAGRGAQSGYTNAFGLTGLAQESAGEVAVGHAGSERQITHVAAGSDDHDAVNVLQLQGAVNAATNGAVLYDLDSSGNPVNQVTLIGDGSGAPVGIDNLAPGQLGATSTEAVNGSQLYATNTTIGDYFGGSTSYDGGTNTWTPPDFAITSIDNQGDTTTGSYDNVTDAFSALDNSVTNVNDRVTNIYETGVKYFHANSSGTDSAATGADSIAVGPDATSTGDDAIAIGSGADASMDGSIALGSGATTTVGAQTDYSAYGITAPQTSAGEVNLGNRQITGVAAGSADQDAVNVAQLKGVASVADNAVQYDDAGKTMVTLAGPVSADGGLTDGTVLTNLHQGALGATSTDAVNGSQLYDTHTTMATYFGGTTNYDGATNTWTPPNFSITSIDDHGNETAGDYDNVTDAFDAVDGSLTNINKRITQATGDMKYFHANSTGADSDASGDRSVAMGGDAASVGAGSVAAGDGAKAQTDGAVAIGQDAVADGGQAVAIGNGAQASGDGAVSIGDPNVVVGDGAVGLGKDNQVTGDGAVALGQDNQANGQGAVAFGNNAVADADGALALGNDASATVEGGVALGAGSVADRTGSGQEAFSNVAVPTEGAISVGSDGAERQITHLAGGTEDTDAVNLRQLKEVDSHVTDLGQLAVLYDDSSKSQVTFNGGGASVLLTNVAAGAESASSLDAVNGSQLYYWTQDTGNDYSNYNLYQQIQNLTNSGEFAVNNTDNLPPAEAQGDNSAAGGVGTVAAGSDSTALGNGAQAEGDNSVALGAGSVAKRDNTVSVGSSGHERQVTHVAAGSEDTDAVNVAQLNKSTSGTVRYDQNKDGSTDYTSITLGNPAAGSAPARIHNVADGKADTDAANVRQVREVQNWAKNYTDEQINGLNHQLNNLGSKAYAGVASAMAMAGLPQAYLPGKNMVSLAGSSFHGESSLAVGVSMISEGGSWVYKLNGTSNSRGDAGVSVGVGIQW